MKSFEKYNPVSVLIWFLSAGAAAMFIQDPLIALISFIGATGFYIIKRGKAGLLLSLFLLSAVMTVINPLFSHNGKTVLFYLNDNPITAEATFYGFVSSLSVISVIILFSVFSKIMTSDKLLYIFGSLSPKTALVLSSVLRYIPLFTEQAGRISQAQKAMGRDGDGSLPDRIKSGYRVFSVMVTWTLENGIITADSMTARGYGTGRRTFFSLYKFTLSDSIFSFISILLLISTLYFRPTFVFYPSVCVAGSNLYYISYISYALLSFIPIITETEEKIKWSFLKSRI